MKKNSEKLITWESIYEVESDLIRDRRRVAFGAATSEEIVAKRGGQSAADKLSKSVGPEEETDSPDTPETVSDTDGPIRDVVGLALSGGGIRSAIFGDGFLQALSHRGLLRYVDYLCSVSGGGYIAGHLLGLAGRSESNPGKAEDFHNEEPRTFSNHDSHQSTSWPRWWLGRNPHTGAENAFRLKGIGGYLKETWHLLPGYLLHLVCTWCFYFGMLGIGAATAALFWRSFDMPMFRYLLTTVLDIRTGHEFLRAFFPSVLLAFVFLVWMVCELCRRSPVKGLSQAPLIVMLACAAGIVATLWLTPDLTGFFVVLTITIGIYLGLQYLVWASSSSERRWIRSHWPLMWSGYALAASLLVSLAVFLGNGKTKVTDTGTEYYLNDVLTYVGGLAALTQVVVLIMRKQIALSDREDSSSWKRMAQFGLAWSVLLLTGFSVVHWMARENISGYVNHRDAYLIRGEIEDWDALVRVSEEFDRKNLIVWDLSDNKKPIPQLWLVGTEFRSVSNWANRRRNSPLVFSRESQPKNPLEELALLEQNVPYFHRILQIPSAWFAANLGHPLGMTPEVVSLNANSVHPGHIMHYVGLAHQANKNQDDFLVHFNDGLDAPAFTSFLLGKYRENGKPASVGLIHDPLKFDSQLETVKKLWSGDNEKKFVELQQLASILPPKNNRDESATSLASQWRRRQRAELNRDLLELTYPTIMQPLGEASTFFLPPHDQLTRANWLVIWLGVFFAGFFGLELLGILGMTSGLSRFYRHQVGNRFLQPKVITETIRRGQLEHRTLNDSDATSEGMPYPIFLAAHARSENIGSSPSQVRYRPFVLTPGAVGMHAESSEVSCELEYALVQIPSRIIHCGGRVLRRLGMAGKRGITLAQAVALSGAALTPWMTNNRAMRMILRAFDLDLGQRLVIEKRIGARKLKRECNVVDGGFYDYLGVSELLRRRCGLIIVSDAGCNDGENTLKALALMCERMTAELGIKFLDLDHEGPIDFGRLDRKIATRNGASTEQRLVHQPFIIMRIRYPGQANEARASELDGMLVYCQMGITEKDPVEIQQIRHRFPKFPDEPTMNQFYSDDQVSAYRQLGYHIGSRLCSELVRWETRPDGNFANNDFLRFSDIDSLHGPERLRNLLGWHVQSALPELEEKGNHQPGYREIVERLLTSYRLACFEEVSYDKDDILKEALWTHPNEHSPSFHRALESCLSASIHDDHRSPFTTSIFANRSRFDDRWLNAYQGNADIRTAYRNAVLNDTNSLVFTSQSDIGDVFSIMYEMAARILPAGTAGENALRAEMISGHLACAAVAAQEVCRGRPHSAFQIGGRRRLLLLTQSLAQSTSFWIERLQNGQINDLPNETDCPRCQDLFENSVCEITEMEHTVFHGAEYQTTVSFAQCFVIAIASYARKQPGFEEYFFRDDPVVLAPRNTSGKKKAGAQVKTRKNRKIVDMQAELTTESESVQFRQDLLLCLKENRSAKIAGVLTRYFEALFIANRSRESGFHTGIRPKPR